MPHQRYDRSSLDGRDKGHEHRGYEWKVIVDPTRGEDNPGLFFGGLFRMVDLRLDRDEKSTWPDGIVFENVLTHCRLTFEKGKLIDLTHSRVLEKKPRQIKKTNSNQISRGAMKPGVTKSEPQNSRMRRFILIRNRDVTGVSGTGVIAEGMVFTDGLSVIHWLREPFATGVYPTVNDVIAVHGHEGATEIQFIDEGNPAIQGASQ